MTKPTFSYNLPVVITKQNKRFVAYTPALDISTSGKTQKEAQRRFAEMAHIFLEELVAMNTIDSVLGELGWTCIQKKWTPPKVVASTSVKLSLPAFA